MKKPKDLAIAENGSVDNFISQAIAANAPIETLERLFALHKDVKAEQAREAFTQALANFQGDCPIIAAHSTVKCNKPFLGVEENLARGLIAEYLSGARVEFVLDPLYLSIRQDREV